MNPTSLIVVRFLLIHVFRYVHEQILCNRDNIEERREGDGLKVNSKQIQKLLEDRKKKGVTLIT